MPRDETPIHTHVCYSEFNDIMGSIAERDADVITIELALRHGAARCLRALRIPEREVIPALRNKVAAARRLREEV